MRGNDRKKKSITFKFGGGGLGKIFLSPFFVKKYALCVEKKCFGLCL